MTGRDLIIYILENKLEDKPVFENGTFIGFMTSTEAAAKMNVGIGSIYTWVALGMLEGHIVDRDLCIPANSEAPMEIK